MKIVTIDGKRIKLKATGRSAMELIKKFNLMNMQDVHPDSIFNFYYEAIWKFIVPKYGFLKPFLTFRRFKNKFDLEELREIGIMILPMLYGSLPEVDESKKK